MIPRVLHITSSTSVFPIERAYCISSISTENAKPDEIIITADFFESHRNKQAPNNPNGIKTTTFITRDIKMIGSLKERTNKLNGTNETA